jgi:hypothetical protein
VQLYQFNSCSQDAFLGISYLLRKILAELGMSGRKFPFSVFDRVPFLALLAELTKISPTLLSLWKGLQELADWQAYSS